MGCGTITWANAQVQTRKNTLPTVSDGLLGHLLLVQTGRQVCMQHGTRAHGVADMVGKNGQRNDTDESESPADPRMTVWSLSQKKKGNATIKGHEGQLGAPGRRPEEALWITGAERLIRPCPHPDADCDFGGAGRSS